MIVIGPIAATWWQQMPHREFRTHVEVDAADPALAPYLASRPVIIERLLPEGRGGTRFYASLDGKGGMAGITSGSVAVAVGTGMLVLDEVEIHERAHLLHALAPEAVAELITRLPKPHPDEYAATDPGEHFSEMAANAWRIIRPPDALYCTDAPTTLLRNAEARVPGTAGFLTRFLAVQSDETLSHVEELPALRALARDLSAQTRPQWDAIWTHVEAQRRADGTLAPLPRQSISDDIATHRRLARTSGRWHDRVIDWMLWPSETLARLWMTHATQ
jgi:hypothetical protein